MWQASLRIQLMITLLHLLKVNCFTLSMPSTLNLQIDIGSKANKSRLESVDQRQEKFKHRSSTCWINCLRDWWRKQFYKMFFLGTPWSTCRMFSSDVGMGIWSLGQPMTPGDTQHELRSALVMAVHGHSLVTADPWSDSIKTVTLQTNTWYHPSSHHDTCQFHRNSKVKIYKIIVGHDWICEQETATTNTPHGSNEIFLFVKYFSTDTVCWSPGCNAPAAREL